MLEKGCYDFKLRIGGMCCVKQIEPLRCLKRRGF